MTDWLLLCVPLVVLGVVILLVFAGCQVVFPLDEYKEEESTGTTHGTGPPDLIPVEVEISAGCDAAANAFDIILSTDAEQASFTVTSISSAAQTLSTMDLKITLEDEEQVVCTVWITPAEGEAPPPLSMTHDKIKGELVAPFILSCEDGFQLT
jgi:hypothetical protein